MRGRPRPGQPGRGLREVGLTWQLSGVVGGQWLGRRQTDRRTDGPAQQTACNGMRGCLVWAAVGRARRLRRHLGGAHDVVRCCHCHVFCAYTQSTALDAKVHIMDETQQPDRHTDRQRTFGPPNSLRRPANKKKHKFAQTSQHNNNNNGNDYYHFQLFIRDNQHVGIVILLY